MKLIMKNAINRVCWLLTLMASDAAEHERQNAAALAIRRNWDDTE